MKVMMRGTRAKNFLAQAGSAIAAGALGLDSGLDIPEAFRMILSPLTLFRAKRFLWPFAGPLCFPQPSAPAKAEGGYGQCEYCFHTTWSNRHIIVKFRARYEQDEAPFFGHQKFRVRTEVLRNLKSLGHTTKRPSPDGALEQRLGLMD